MLNITTEIMEVKDEDGSIRKREYAIVNGIADLDSFVLSSGYRSAHFYNVEVLDILLGHSFNEVGKSFGMIGYGEEFDWWEDYLSIDVYCSKYYHQTIPGIRVKLQLQDWEYWAKPWSMSKLAEEFKTNIIKSSDSSIQYWQDDEESMLNGFGVDYHPSNDNLIIGEQVKRLMSKLEHVVMETNRNLLEYIDSGAVFTYFQFPEEIKTACEQYLIYFNQFLKDLGIEAETEIKEQAKSTLFKVMPKDKNEALDKIKEALEVYINIPGINDSDFENMGNGDVAFFQLQANIMHLKSQLMFANATIELKDATIQALRLSNYQLTSNSSDRENEKIEDEESIIPNILSVKKFEWKGIIVNTPVFVRQLKRFGRNKLI